MADTAQTSANTSKLQQFDIVDAVYKTVDKTPIHAAILVPRDAQRGIHPVIVRWHGGCFITGHHLYERWFGEWTLDFALSQQAIIISPDYRLLPEANAGDILNDIVEFYNWLEGHGGASVKEFLPDGAIPDVAHLMVMGESAGGWHAIQSGFVSTNVSVIVARYPMLDMRDKWYTQDYEKAMFDPPAARVDESILRDYIAGLKGDEVVTGAEPPDRVPLVQSIMQQGAYSRLFGQDAKLYPIEMLDSGAVSGVPPTWILHGTNDTVVPIEGSHRYINKLRERFPEAKIHLTVKEGGKHGFDNTAETTRENEWVDEGLRFVSEFWPEK